MKVFIAGEGSAYALEVKVAEFLKNEGYDFTDGTVNDHMTYIEAGSAVACAVAKDGYDLGIVMCGTGMGVNLVANRYSGVYCGLCESVDTAKMARTITNCNVLALGANIVSAETACKMVKTFLDTEFTEGFDENKKKELKALFEDMEEVDRAQHE